MNYIVTRDISYQGTINPNSNDIKHFRFFKYIKREKGPNGKWKYYYDEDGRAADRAKSKNEPNADINEEVVEGLSTDAARAEKIEEKKAEKLEPDKITKEELKEYEEIVNEVIRGKWDNGQKRWKDLEEAGYDWAHIQNLVNEKLGDPTRHETKGTKTNSASAKSSTVSDPKQVQTKAKKIVETNAVNDANKVNTAKTNTTKSNSSSTTKTNEIKKQTNSSTPITTNQTSSANRKPTSGIITKGVDRLNADIKKKNVDDLLRKNRGQVDSMTDLIKRLKK